MASYFNFIHFVNYKVDVMIRLHFRMSVDGITLYKVQQSEQYLAEFKSKLGDNG